MEARPISTSTDMEPTLAWLIDGARSATSPEALTQQLCERLVAGGFAIWRAAVFIRTLHPSVFGRMFVWRQGEEVHVLDAPLNRVESEVFQSSPIPRVVRTGETIRRRICDPDCPADYPILADLAAEGVTDYVAAPLDFTDGARHVLTLTTKQAGGFSAVDMERIALLLPAVSRVTEVRVLRRTAVSLLDLYVGHDAGERILAGKIQRGDTEKIRAAIWLSDMRGFTRLADQAPPERVIERLNAFFDSLAQPIEAHGGSVLKFMGDGMLAIFPVRGDDSEIEARARALAAARNAVDLVASFNESDAAQPDGPLRFGLALHFGEALYGNIGGGSRLDFTCIGPAINLAARIEKVAARLGRTVLASAAFAEGLTGEFEALGAFELSGFQAPQELYGLPGEGG